MTLKIGPKSPKSNQLVPPSQQCICASLVKIRPSVQKITRRNEATTMQTPTGSAQKQYVPPPFRFGGHNFCLLGNRGTSQFISGEQGNRYPPDDTRVVTMLFTLKVNMLQWNGHGDYLGHVSRTILMNLCPPNSR